MIDLINKKFNKLLVIQKLGKDYRNKQLWKCLCDCGNIVNYITNVIISGHSGSCGCSRITNDQGEAGFKKVLDSYKRKAKKRNLCFKLSIKYFEYLTKQNCFYCGSEPKSISKPIRAQLSLNHSIYVYNGIDRMNNKKGYIKSNCVTCCKTCNFAKYKMTFEEYNEWIKQLIRYKTGLNYG